MSHRYVLRVAVLDIGDSSTELFIGINSDESLDATDLIPADDMTEAELSVVSRWITVPHGAQSLDQVR